MTKIGYNEENEIYNANLLQKGNEFKMAAIALNRSRRDLV